MNNSRRTPSVYLFIILAVNLALKLYDVNWSLSNDELSAVYRSSYSTFSELIQYGVIQTDPHPAGVQVFLFFWLKVFSNDVLIRLPFVLASTLSLVFIYALFKSWFDEQKALLSTLLYGVMFFTLVHGQLARPYAFGILTVSIFVWSWNKLLIESKFKPSYILSFIISAALSCYMHYYAALMVGIVSFVGIFPAFKKKKLIPYLLFGFTALLLFMPHLGITLQQLSRGPLTSWIDPVGPDFIFEHMFYLLNESWALLILCAILIQIGIINTIRENADFATLRYPLLFFFLPFVVGYLYSLFFGSSLMHRVLYFSAPYFFIFPFFGLPEFEKKSFKMIFFSVLAVGLSTTLMSGKFLEKKYVENFKAIAQDLQRSIYENSETPILHIGNYNSVDYVNHYNHGNSIQFEISELDSDEKVAKAMRIIRQSENEIITLSWSCKYQPIAVVEYAKLFFPNALQREVYYNGGFWLFNKEKRQRDTLLWDEVLKDTILKEKEEFIDVVKYKKSDLTGVLNVRVNFTGKELKDVLLVYSVTNPSNEGISWRGHHFSSFAQEGSEIFTSYKFPDDFDENDILSVYIWNPGKKKVQINSAVISSFKDGNYPELY